MKPQPYLMLTWDPGSSTRKVIVFVLYECRGQSVNVTQAGSTSWRNMAVDCL